MRRSTIASAVGIGMAMAAFAAAAGKDSLVSYTYVAQGQCMTAPGFIQPSYEPLNPANIGWQTWTGTMMIDFANDKAFDTEAGTYFVLPYMSGPDGTPSGQHPVGFWKMMSPCVFKLHLARDRHFTLEASSEGCSSTGNLDDNITTVTRYKLAGRFSPDMQTFVAGTAGLEEPVAQHIVARTPAGETVWEADRICTQVLQGTR